MAFVLDNDVTLMNRKELYFYSLYNSYFMKRIFFYLLLASSILLIKCQKELSFDTGGTPSQGSLQDDGSGDCLPKTLNGNYIAQASLTSSNTMQVTVNVTTVGSYNIFSDTVNNYYFKATGIFSTLGSHSVTLKGTGKPLVEGVDNFLIQYDSTACNVAVTVLPAGTTNAVLTMDCTNATVNGTYQTGTALSSSTNTVVLPVTVTTAGAYSISGSANGMTFSGSGTVTTSTTSITLQGNGTPTTAQTTSVPVSFGTSNCSFSVTVTAGSGGGGGGGGGSGYNWSFNQGSTAYNGPTTGALEAAIGGFDAVSVNGTSTAPSTDYALILQMTKSGTMSTGTFTTTSLTNSVAFTLINQTTSQTTFSSFNGDGSNLTVHITTYDPVGKIVQGDFSGTAKNATGGTVNITSGTFKAQIQ